MPRAIEPSVNAGRMPPLIQTARRKDPRESLHVRDPFSSSTMSSNKQQMHQCWGENVIAINEISMSALGILTDLPNTGRATVILNRIPSIAA